MLTAFARAFRTPDLRRKILFTAAIMALFRLGSFIPTPGVSYSAVQQCVDLTSQLVTQFGEPTAGRPTQPQTRKITLSRPSPGKPYLISKLAPGEGACAPE